MRVALLVLLLAVGIQAQTPAPTPLKIGEQPVVAWDAALFNFTCGKVSGSWQSSYGSQNFLCGNMTYIPTTGTANTGFGWDIGRPTTGTANTFFGHDAGLGITTGGYNTFLGRAAGPPDQSGSIQVSESIGIGAHAQVRASHQLVVGGEVVGYVTDGYIGGGVTTPTARTMTLQTTGGEGSNKRGWSLTIGAGKSTGSALPGVIDFAVSKPGPSGPTPQPLIKYWRITESGSFRALTPDSKLEVNKLLMKSPGGLCHEFSATDSGLLTSTPVTCP